jgi:hypothetical protein
MNNARERPRNGPSTRQTSRGFSWPVNVASVCGGNDSPQPHRYKRNALTKLAYDGSRMKAALLMLGGYLATSPAAAPSAKPAPPPCPVEKINFTKETGCQNDGYVRFCVPEGKKVRAAIKRIAPTAEKRSEQKCSEKEVLYFLPIGVEQGSCVERGGAMTDKAWNQVCALARLPQISGIRQVRFE